MLVGLADGFLFCLPFPSLGGSVENSYRNFGSHKVNARGPPSHIFREGEGREGAPGRSEFPMLVGLVEGFLFWMLLGGSVENSYRMST